MTFTQGDESRCLPRRVRASMARSRRQGSLHLQSSACSRANAGRPPRSRHASLASPPDMSPVLALLLALDTAPTLSPAPPPVAPPSTARDAGAGPWGSLLLRAVPAAPASLELGDLGRRRGARLPTDPGAEQPWHWKKKAGLTCTLAGLALAAGGGVTTALTQGPASRLDAKFRSRSLTLDDRGAYDDVTALNALAVGLYVLGGAVTTTGITLWSLAPTAKVNRQGASLGVSGSF